MGTSVRGAEVEHGRAANVREGRLCPEGRTPAIQLVTSGLYLVPSTCITYIKQASQFSTRTPRLFFFASLSRWKISSAAGRPRKMRMGHVESELRTVIWPVPQRHCVRESSESPWRGHDRQQHACAGVLLQREQRCLDAECGSTLKVLHSLPCRQRLGSAWAAGHATMLQDTTAALRDGLVVGKDWDDVLGGTVNTLLHEGCSASNDAIRNLRALADKSEQTGQAPCGAVPLQHRVLRSDAERDASNRHGGVIRMTHS